MVVLSSSVAAAAGTSFEELAAAAKKDDGTVYNDEVEAPRETLSPAMKARLRREASTGLDSDAGQTNVIWCICVAVALLVAVGGRGILY